MNPARLAQLQKQAGSVRTGGKGSMRRKKKVVRKNQVQNDKRLQQTMKRLPGAQQVREADEVQFFKDDGTVLVLRQAQLLAAFQSNCFVVSGNAETKNASDVSDTFDMDALLRQAKASGVDLSSLGGGAGADDDDVPDLVDSSVNFEEVATND